jgi:hypothetical protein
MLTAARETGAFPNRGDDLRFAKFFCPNSQSVLPRCRSLYIPSQHWVEFPVSQVSR